MFDVYNGCDICCCGQMVIDTLLLCFCEDSELNDGSEDRPYFMSTSLMVSQPASWNHAVKQMESLSPQSWFTQHLCLSSSGPLRLFEKPCSYLMQLWCSQMLLICLLCGIVCNFIVCSFSIRNVQFLRIKVLRQPRSHLFHQHMYSFIHLAAMIKY